MKKYLTFKRQKQKNPKIVCFLDLNLIVMAQIQYVDDLIREYMLFRGFSNTIKSFEVELKSDNKDKSFRVDKIIDQITLCINSHDLQSLKDIWNHLEGHLFNKLEHSFTTGNFINTLERTFID